MDRNSLRELLAAIVLAAVMSLVDLRALRHIWRFSRGEFFVAIAALVGVLGSGPVNGVLLGAAMSIVLLLRQGARPLCSSSPEFLGRYTSPIDCGTPRTSESLASW